MHVAELTERQQGILRVGHPRLRSHRRQKLAQRAFASGEDGRHDREL